jgi:glycerol-3-phosphate acyltransferase PlsY
VTLPLPAALAASYLLGAIPTSLIAARLLRGVDLRRVGSGNLGATNLYRAAGWKAALPVALFDIAKGLVPATLIAGAVGTGPRSAGVALACGLAAVAGHVYSVFARFQGGKGVATGAGAMLGLAPLAVVAAAGVWALVTFTSGYVSLGSMIAALALVPAVRLLYPDQRGLLPFYLLLALGIVWAHRANLGRLRAGTEHRFGRHGSGAGDGGTGKVRP